MPAEVVSFEERALDDLVKSVRTTYADMQGAVAELAEAVADLRATVESQRPPEPALTLVRGGRDDA